MENTLETLNRRLYKLERQLRGLKGKNHDLQNKHDKVERIFNNAERFKDLPPRKLWPLKYRIKAEPKKVELWLTKFSEKHEIKRANLSASSRVAEIVNARHVAMWFLKVNTSNSFKAIGEIFDRDHSTALHAHKKVENLLFIGDSQIKFSVDVAHFTALEVWPVNDWKHKKETQGQTLCK